MSRKKKESIAANAKVSDKSSGAHESIDQPDVARWGFNLGQSEHLDDWSSEWEEVLRGNGAWGGRKRGGRGVSKITGMCRDISVEGVTLSFCGKELLQRTSLKLVHQHRYGLIGENGVGKSTLLRRLASHSIPGIPLHFRFGYIQQEIPLYKDMRVLDYILFMNESNGSVEDQINDLRQQEALLDKQIEETDDTDILAMLAEQLCAIGDEIESLEATQKNAVDFRTNECSDAHAVKSFTRDDLNALGQHTVQILDGLGLSRPLSRLHMNLSELSGGWRMRAALAQTLCTMDDIDVLLLDEPTNHLDLPTISWLQQYLISTQKIIVFVSHDRSFLDAVATDIIHLKDLKLHYFPGSYSDWLRHEEEMMTRHQHALDARHRKEIHIQESLHAAYTRGDDKLVRNKTKKLERAAFTKNIDGHKFKLYSLEKLDEKYIRMPEILEAQREKYQLLKFKFPLVDSISLRLATPSSPVLTLEKCSCTYEGRIKPILSNITLSLTLQSRVGIIGRNGQGKSTLVHILAYATSIGTVHIPSSTISITATTTTSTDRMKNLTSDTNKLQINEGDTKIQHCDFTNDNKSSLELCDGVIWRHHNLKIGMISQHQIDTLSTHLYETPISYLQLIMKNTSELDIRAHLGAFGLSGNVALQPIGSLSGGQKARLSFATVCIHHPHILFLDEPTNHLSLDSIEALITACQDFSGGLVIISHNQYFLSQTCNELYVIDNQSHFFIHKVVQTVDTIERMMSTTRSSIHCDDSSRYEFSQLLASCLRKQMT